VGGISLHYASISHVPSCFCRAGPCHERLLHTLILSFSFFCLGTKCLCDIRNQASSLLLSNLSKFAICVQPEMVGQTCRKKYDCSVIVHFNYFWNFRVFLARQPQGVLLDHVPPFKPCANAFFSLLLCFKVASRSRQVLM
jgi:hypothetical protein